MSKIYRVFFCFLLFSFTAVSADEDHLESVDEELIVISSRIPTVASEVIGSVDSISSQDLDLKMIDGLAELVRFIPGVSAHKENQYGRSFTEDLHIRGIHGGAIYLIDGQRISDSYTGYGRDIVDTDLLKKVEIMKGPSSVEYGSDGLAGAISYVTKDPSDLVEGGDRYLSINASTQQSNKQEKLNFLTAAAGENIEGLLQLVHRGLNETKIHDGFSLDANPFEGNQKSLLAKTIIHYSETTIFSLVADMQEWDGDWIVNTEKGFVYFPAPRAVSSSIGEDEGSRERINFKIDLSPKNSSLLDTGSFTVFTQDTEQRQLTVQQQVSFLNGMQAAPTPTMRMSDFEFNQSLKGMTLQAYKTLTKHQMVYGLDYERTETTRPRMRAETNLITGTVSFSVDGENYPNKTFPDSKSVRKALFFNDRINLSDNQILSLGVRYDNYELNTSIDSYFLNGNSLGYQIKDVGDSETSIKVGYLYDISPDLTFYSQYSEGFRAPDYESANTVFTNFAYRYTVRPNPNLQSETSKSYEIGFRGQQDLGEWKLTLFKNRVKDFINAEAIGFSPLGLVIYQYDNHEGVEIEGLEFEYNREISQSLYAKFAVAISSGEDDAGESLAEVDPKEVIIGLDWISSNEKWGMQGLVNLVDSSKDDLKGVPTVGIGHECGTPGNECTPRATTSGYGLIDIFGFYNHNDNFQLRLSVENLTDKKYIRWASVAELPENDEELALFGEPGRSINASFRYRF
ncbi:MAG: TonB-dependent hemoglobin/transferrin/lactoferrin family receptor [Candidatus Thioglobus sp.]|nr:TonB-dependent hemoglobin/transferrin/lactoferrin family receptor [Candidatus Thioglobus sp.]